MRLKPLLSYLALILVLAVPALFAQQTGSISGRVTADDGSALPGVTLEARSPVLPQPRVTTTSETGEFRLPVLPPGDYTVEFSLAGLQSRTRNVKVLLAQDTIVNVSLGVQQIAETITVTAEASMVDPSSTAIASALSNDVIKDLPVGQEYADLVKLIPGVMYTEDATRGPSAGGSGQDNAYNFDGVNVTLPLFGTLSAEPSSHDIAQIATVKGGAKAIDFNRAGGFWIDSVSKSGTSEFAGEVSYQVEDRSLTADDKTGGTEFEQDKTWATINLGGPIISDRLFFYGSYYRPTVDRENRSNLYGDVPDYESTRDEVFGKLTFTPTSSILLHGSYRDSEREERFAGVAGSTTASTASVGNDATLGIAILEGSWVITSRSFATFKVTDFANETQGRPDLLLSDVRISTAPGTRLDINNLERQGLLQVPLPISGQTAYNQFIGPLIDKYGFVRDGARTGGGFVGAATTFNDQDFFRQSAQLGYDFTLGQTVTHDIHVGYQWYTDEEDLRRTSNGWGLITVPGGRVQFQGQPVFFQVRFQQQTLGEEAVPVIHSEFEAQNIEVNDTIQWGSWAFNVGVLASQDTLFGQGLREDPSTISGYVAARGNKYKMYQVDFADMIQPRLGATWAYNGIDTAYASWSRYHPAASSLPRAASWDRNLAAEIIGHFDQNGNLIGVNPLAGSSGKLFQDDLEPRVIDEYMLGTSQQITSRWTGRAYGRYRYATNFWEDTNNDARIRFQPPEGIPRELYIPDLAAKLAQIGSGSSYVIAELDGAFTKYYEVSLESEFRATRTFLRGSYTWSHYYGNFDQDNTTTENDQNIFIGSSFTADGAGRQLWNFRYGDLRGDRRHSLKVYGYYTLPWNATAGAFGVYQSGQPWEAWNVELYRSLTTSTDDTARFAEPAGSRKTDNHYQIDLNYSQNFRISGYNLQLEADLYNVTDNQTGYNIQNKVNLANFGEPRSYYDPRRIQLALRFQF